MNKTLSIIILALGCALSSTAWAQDGSIRGRVLDAANQGSVPGANVLIEGTTLGAATNLQGEYVITGLAPGTYTLVASFIGYQRQTQVVSVAAGEEAEQNFNLQVDRLGLDEVVVTGQGGAIESRRLSTTVETISPAQIEASPAINLEQLLQANLPNTQVRLNSGQPGTSTLIRSRGPTSLSGVTTPVIYVDGVRVDNNNSGSDLAIDTGGARSSSISDIPLENIERVEFIKGGAATTLYGSDAANGVIQIFTKKGVPGRSTFFVETELGVNSGTRDFLRFDRTADALFENGLVQSYTLGGSGGGDKITYSFSGKATRDEGFRLRNESNRYDLRSSVAAEVTPITRYNGSFGYSHFAYERDYNANTSFSQFNTLEGGDFGELDELSDEEFSEIESNVRDVVNLVDLNTTVNRFQTSQNLEFTPSSNIVARFTGGLDYRTSEEGNVLTNAFLQAGGFSGPDQFDQGSVENFTRRFLSLTLEGNVQHRAEFGLASLRSTVGGQVFRDEDRQVYVLASDAAEGTTSINNASDQSAEDFTLEVANYGFYLNENVGLFDRLFLDAGFRIDGNSAFGEDVGSQFYPRLGAAYTLSDEAFFRENVPSVALSTLKLRANYGKAGRFPQPFAGERLVTVAPFLGTPANTFSQPGNLQLSPEVVETFEIGADIGLLNDRVGIEISYYDATTDDALENVPFAPSTGFSNQFRNIGEIRNRGVEIASRFFIIERSDLGLSFNASLNTLDNEVVRLDNTAPFAIGGFSFLGSFIEEGQPIGVLRGGRATFDADGQIADVEDNAILGDPNPDVFGSLGLNLRYKGLTFYTAADYQMGAQGVNVDNVLRFFGGVQDPGTFETPDNSAPAGSFFDFANVFVDDTDYLKVRVISLGYSLPESLVRNSLNSVIDRARITLAVTNPFNFTGASFDPEVTGANGGEVGGVFFFGTESPPRRFSVSLLAGF